MLPTIYVAKVKFSLCTRTNLYGNKDGSKLFNWVTEDMSKVGGGVKELRQEKIEFARGLQKRDFENRETRWPATDPNNCP